jgi:hypothetical protein
LLTRTSPSERLATGSEMIISLVMPPARSQDRTNPPLWFSVASLSEMVQSRWCLSFSSTPIPLHGGGFQNRYCESV